MIKLYEPSEKEFLNNGLGVVEALKCIETKNKSLNGWFIEVEFHIKYHELLKQDYILFVETKEKQGQPFRINNINKTDKKITITANHVIFDAERYMLVDVRPTNLSPVSFLSWFNSRTETTSPFSTTSNVSGYGTTYFIRKSLLEAFTETELLFGGTYDVDKFNISLMQKVGNDDGETLVYGKNIQSASVVEDWSTVCTRCIAVGPDELMLPEKYIDSSVQYDKPFTKTVTFDFETKDENDEDIPVEEQIVTLRKMTTDYLETSYIPNINYVIKSDVSQTLRIGDTIKIKHPLLTINTEVQSYTYDVNKKRVVSIEFGNYSRDVKKLFDKIKEDIKTSIDNSQEAKSLTEKQTDIINNLNKHGIVYIDDNEILILDELPKEEANRVWRFGLGGIGFSTNGINGPFDFAFTSDGKLNVDFIHANSITVNKLNADVGSSLDLSSNKSINLIVEEINEDIKKIPIPTAGTEAPENPLDGQIWIDITFSPPLEKIYKNNEWTAVGDYSGKLDSLDGLIETLNTSITIEQGKITNLIKNNTTIINGQEVTLKEAYSYMQQEIDNIKFSISESGGNNILLNSCGWKGTEFWTKDGVVETQTSVDVRSNTISEYAFVLGSGTLSQVFKTIVGKKYSVSCKIKKSINACHLKIINSNEEEYVFKLNDEYVDGWVYFSLPITALANTCTIEIWSETSELLISDIMINDGEIAQQWTSSNNEIYTLNVQIDKQGISIKKDGTNEKTVINTYEFAGYDEENKVFTVNGDTTEVNRLNARSDVQIGLVRGYAKTTGSEKGLGWSFVKGVDNNG